MTRGKYRPRVSLALARLINEWHKQSDAKPTAREMRQQYGISRQQLYDVVHHRTYKWLR
jgi:hypothetical protein